MLIRISNVVEPENPSICAYKKFLAQTIVEKDIGAQDMCHMLLNIPLVISSHSFVSVNVGRKIFKRVSSNSDNNKFPTGSGFLEHYQNRPPFLEHLSLIETARSWSFSGRRQREPWKPRDTPTIVRVWPRFCEVPNNNSDSFESFCLS